MGLDIPIDFFSDNIYRGSVVFLDTNFIHHIAFSKSNRHNEFKEILKNAKKLGITFSVSELTIAEIYQRVTKYKDILEQSEDLIPDELIEEVQDEIVHSEEKAHPQTKIDLDSSPNADRLRKMGVEILEFNPHDKFFNDDEIETVSGELKDFDRKSRPSFLRKDEDAIFHDAYLCFLTLDKRKKGSPNSAWFLTEDNSVIQHAISRKAKEEAPYAIKLLTLLQTLSPFIESQALKGEFADLFADLISKDLLPQERLFSLEDLKMLVGFDLKAKSIPPEFIRKATYHIKTNILKGGGVTEENKNLVVQEFIKYLATPEQNFTEFHKKFERKLKDREEEIKDKERIIEEIKDKSKREKEDLTKEIESLSTNYSNLSSQFQNFKNLLFKGLTVLVFLSISFLIWFTKSLFYLDILNKFNNPIFFKSSLQFVLISSALVLLFPEKKKLIGIAGLIGAFGAILLSIANL